MNLIMIQLLTAFLGALGFSLLFHLRAHLVLPACIGALLGWGVYLCGTKLLTGIFLPCLLASAFTALYAEILARILKTPATILFIPAVVPLIPGSTLYYTMSHAVQGEWKQAELYGSLTVQYALAIAGGISLVWAFWGMGTKVLQKK